MFISYFLQFKHPVDHFLFSVTTSLEKPAKVRRASPSVVKQYCIHSVRVLRHTHTSVFNHIKKTPAGADVTATSKNCCLVLRSVYIIVL